jgi:DNA-directed RNA polymerase specialized sigma24 family protein
MDLVFCAGAWAAVIIIAHAVIDAWLRDTETGDYNSSSHQLFGDDEDLQWLRKKRNQLVHVREEQKTIDEAELHRIEENYESLEPDARRAICLVFRVMYANPGT